MTNIILNNVSNKKEIIEELINIYGDVFINEILQNKDIETQYIYNNILIS
jgi:hypothetical protein